MDILTNPLVEALILLIVGFILHRNRETIKKWFNSDNASQVRRFTKELEQREEPGPPSQATFPQVGPETRAESPSTPASTPVLAPAARPAPPVPIVRPASDGGDWLAAPIRKGPRIRLSEVAQTDNIAIIGQKGAGKTTLLLTVMRHRESDYVVLDPHNAPGKWLTKQVIGGGRDYQAIKTALLNLDGGMNKRFGQLNSGEVAEGMFARRTLVADEFRSIAQNVPTERGEKGAGRYILDRISEGRKVGECVLLAGHNDTVTDLGIEGSSAMKTCFDFVVYMGGIAFQRYGAQDKGGATAEMLAELRLEQRPAVVWKTDTSEWFLLDFDLEPIMMATQMAPLEPAEPAEPVRAQPAESPTIPLLEPVREPVRDSSAHREAVGGSSGLTGVTDRYELVRELVRAGLTGNKINELLGGTRSDNLGMVRRARLELGLADAA